MIFDIDFPSLEAAIAAQPEAIAAHLARSKQFHDDGKLMMAGAFLEPVDMRLQTMAVLISWEDAEAYIQGDPFVLNGKVRQWTIRQWATLVAGPKKS